MSENASKTLKVLLATGLYPPEIGGPATYAKLLNDTLPEKGYKLSVLPYSVVRSTPKIFRHVAYFFLVCKHGWSVDCIFAQDTISVGLPAMIASKLLRKQFVIRVPGDYAWEQSVQRFEVDETIDEFQTKKHRGMSALLRWLQSKVVRGADRVITPSDYFNRLVQGWGVKPERVITIYNGINLSDTVYWKAVEGRAAKTIVSSGRLVPWKGFSALIQMLQELPGWTLKIVGDGPDRAELEVLADSLSVSNQVVFMGKVPRAELRREYQNASAFVLNTHFESFSFATAEALAIGVPTIVTNVGSLPELVTDKIHGRLVIPDDTSAIVSILKDTLESTEEWDVISENAKQKAQSFSIESTINQVDELLRSVIKK